jgi:two-component system response regulator YesN
MLNEKIKVVLAEDEAVLCRSIAAKIEKTDADFVVVSRTSDGRQALGAVRDLSPDVLITDIKMPVMDGLELIRQMRLSYPKVKLVVLTGYSDFAYVQQAIRSGVSGYLLKPVEDEELIQTLSDLKNEIVEEQYRQNPVVVHSANYREQAGKLKNAMFFVCLGNLCYDAADAYLASWYEKKLSPLRWPAVLDGLLAEMEDWSVFDEEMPNEKLITCRLRPEASFSAEETAKQLLERLRGALPELPVTICVSQYPQEQENVWMCSRRLRKLLEQRLAAARTSIFVLEQEETAETDDLLGMVKLRVNEQLRQAIEQGSNEAAESELKMIFAYMAAHGVPQQDVQKIIVYILRMREFSGGRSGAACQAETMRALSCASDTERLVRELVSRIMGYLSPHAGGTELAVQLQNYVDRHFMKLEQMEDLADVFRYSYAYLSRLFKKQTGVSISRYVLEKRLELAKQLIENNDALSMAKVAEMSGFADRRYFLRAFKAYTGKSPTAYKNSIIIKG